MDHHATSLEAVLKEAVRREGVRKKAVAWLQDVLDKAAGKSSHQTANCVLDLVLQNANPVKDLILASCDNGTFD